MRVSCCQSQEVAERVIVLPTGTTIGSEEVVPNRDNPPPGKRWPSVSFYFFVSLFDYANEEYSDLPGRHRDRPGDSRRAQALQGSDVPRSRARRSQPREVCLFKISRLPSIYDNR